MWEWTVWTSSSYRLHWERTPGFSVPFFWRRDLPGRGHLLHVERNGCRHILPRYVQLAVSIIRSREPDLERLHRSRSFAHRESGAAEFLGRVIRRSPLGVGD